MPPQRWRLTVRRDAIAAALAQRDVLLAWEAALRDSGLLPWPPEWLVRPPVAPPTAPSPGIRVTQPKLVMAAPLPSRMTADRELVDLYLPERVRLHDLRSRLELHLPPGHELVDLYDVWLGSPALPGLVVAADYRVTVSPAGSGLGPVPEGSRPDEASPSPSAHETDAALIAEVIQAILAAADVPRVRGSASRAPVNLRPLIIEVRCAVRADEDSIAAPVAGSAPPASAPAATVGAASCVATTDLWMRLRLDTSAGFGRPDDVIDAIAARMGSQLTVVRQHRERLWLRGEV